MEGVKKRGRSRNERRKRAIGMRVIYLFYLCPLLTEGEREFPKSGHEKH